MRTEQGARVTLAGLEARLKADSVAANVGKRKKIKDQEAAELQALLDGLAAELKQWADYFPKHELPQSELRTGSNLAAPPCCSSRFFPTAWAPLRASPCAGDFPQPAQNRVDQALVGFSKKAWSARLNEPGSWVGPAVN